MYTRLFSGPKSAGKVSVPTGVDAIVAVGGGVLIVPCSSRSASPSGVCRRDGSGFAGAASVAAGAGERCRGSVGIS